MNICLFYQLQNYFKIIFSSLTTELERRLIGDGKKQIFEADKNSGNVPYLRMLTDIVVWGILISNLGATFGNQIFNQLGPQYLSKALGMHPKNAGFAAALPFLLAAAIKIMAGPISDKIGKRLSERTRVILFTSISQVIIKNFSGKSLMFINKNFRKVIPS